jgi:hypothetical protein
LIVRSIEGFAGPTPELEAAIETALAAKTARTREGAAVKPTVGIFWYVWISVASGRMMA